MAGDEQYRDLLRKIEAIRLELEELRRVETATGVELGADNAFTGANSFAGNQTYTGNQAISSVATTGSSLNVTRNLTATSTDSPVVSVVQDHASDDQASLRVQQDGTGNVVTLMDGATQVFAVIDGGHTIVGSGTPGENVVGTFDFAAPTYKVFQIDGAQPRHILRGSSNAAFDFIHTGAASNEKWFLIQNDNGVVKYYSINDDASVRHTLAGFDLETGFTGFGTTAPQGSLHAFNGTGGWMFVTKTAITNSPITIIADGTGDVTKGVVIAGMVTNSVPQTTGTAGSLVANGGTLDISADGGTNVLRFAVSAGGALTVIRQGGAATWEIAVTCVWK